MSKQLEIDGIVINDIYDLAVAALNFGGADDANAFMHRNHA